MPDQPVPPHEPDRLGKPADPREHPVLAGIAALLGVAVVVGAILGGGALVVTKALGVGDDDTSDSSATSSQTLYLPDPTDIGGEDEPYITLVRAAHRWRRRRPRQRPRSRSNPKRSRCQPARPR